MQKSVLSDNIMTLLKWRRFIVRNVAMMTILAIIISLLLVIKYTASATILPPTPDQQSLLGLMPGLMGGGIPSNMSSMLSGVVSGFSTLSDLYASIMQSSRIMREIIKKYDLQKEFRSKSMHDTFKALQDITKIEVSPDGIIKVSVTYRNKFLAADIANSYIEELDRFNTETAMTMGKKYRIFIENRLLETTDSLASAEESLRVFQERNRLIALDSEMEVIIQTIAQLKSQIIMHETQRGAWAAVGQTNNPFVLNIDRELRELKRQLAEIEFGGTKDKKGFGVGFSVPLSKLPDIAIEYARLLRDVQVQGAIYELLTQQYEQAKIMELKDTPTIQFLDRAGPPEKKSHPKRMMIVALAIVISFFTSIPLVFLFEYLIDIKIHPDKHDQLLKFVNDATYDYQELKSFIKELLKSIRN